jgi:hypothetical protein
MQRQREPLNKISPTIMENNMEASHKIKKGLVYNQQPHFWVYMQTEGWVCQRENCTPMVTASLFTIAKL